jgi:hypothetical protein
MLLGLHFSLVIFVMDFSVEVAIVDIHSLSV